ncbi:response regulator transcription factor [Curvibacter sp. CHRR-16]|uniref:response regulator transcription factor n=1 Tax=Curvibacter sp. CHRR-16 TaxID=2835872 RepID=UPI001BDB16F2|nr:response regulator [Curvibacter sp. CHRR-16]MBT0569724.1 response regulator transcription factor [Curvibacter sp. CHRR-16]
MTQPLSPELHLHIVDDDDGVRLSLSTLLTASGHRVHEYASGEDFLAQADTTQPDCVLLDLRLHGMSGLQVHDALRQRASPMGVVFLSGHGDIPTALDAVNHKGALDWIVKGSPNAELLERIARAMQHLRQQAQHQQARQAVLQRWHSLTPREADVARLLRQGLSNKAVAQTLDIGVRAVETHRARVYDKLWVSNPTELERLLREHGVG